MSHVFVCEKKFGQSVPLIYTKETPPIKVITLDTMLLDWTKGISLQQWIRAQVLHCKPDRLHLCDGSKRERRALINKMVRSGTLEPVPKRPNSYLARSTIDDVARVEARTFICSSRKEDAGPLNNWADPEEMQIKIKSLFQNCMRGRTMYVFPFCMGPIGSEHAKIGVQISDSPYVVVNSGIMTRGLGNESLRELEKKEEWTPCLHSVGAPLSSPVEADVAWPCDPENKHIVHFTSAKQPWIASYGSGYGGNALLGKKCLALRIASVLGLKEGWMAEHMLILGLTNPQGKKIYVCAAFPSACGKTNLAMLVPSLPGWKVECVGDDIAWLRFGKDGRLYAVNPEGGMFGVAPGTSMKTNPNALLALEKNCIFTNVASTPDGNIWWEGMTEKEPKKLTDWLRRDWYRNENGQDGLFAERRRKAAHPNSRFTVPCEQCPVISSHFNDPEGVPISAIIFGGRRRDTIPLVFEAYNWNHGVYIGATMLSERTAAAEEAVGELRNDSMAMSPFIGYNVGSYFAHWIKMGHAGKEKMPKIFHVNWFRRNKEGKFLWPGFGENIRILQWVMERCLFPNQNAKKTPIGYIPRHLNTRGISTENLFHLEKKEWEEELERHYKFLKFCGEKVPEEIWYQHNLLKERFK